MTVIGIDPGLDGYVSLVVGGDTDCQPTPTLRVGKGGKRDYDVAGMRRILLQWATEMGKPNIAVLEKQQAFPGQGVSSTFSTGRGFGLWEGLVAGLGMPYTVVHAKTWQAKLLRDIPGDDTKGRSIIAASRLFPGVDLRKTPQCRKPHHGKADSLLLAKYGLLFLGEPA